MPNRDPDPKCRWCKGTGKVALARFVADCDCCAPAGGADAAEDDAFRELLDQLKTLGPPEATNGADTIFLDFDFDGPGGPGPQSSGP